MCTQPVVFVVFVFFRAFVFSCLANFMARHFGYKTLGKTMGVSQLLSGFGGLVQAPLLRWALLPGGYGNFTPPNLLLLGLALLAGALPLWYWLRPCVAEHKALVRR